MIFALPVFRAYATHGNLPCRQLIAAALARLLPEPLLRVAAPSYVEAVVNDRPGGRIVHLLSFIPQKRTPTQEIVEEAIPRGRSGWRSRWSTPWIRCGWNRRVAGSRTRKNRDAAWSSWTGWKDTK